MIRYKTIQQEAYGEQIIERSRFLAYVRPVVSKEEGDAFVAEIRDKHRDATHNVPAMVIGEQFQIQWASDDGEPQGTAGAPMVQMLVKEGLTNLAVVVTRYFGGIKLGTGGLVRAYTSSAKLGLEAAGICAVKDMYTAQVKLDYTYLSKLQNLALNGLFQIDQIFYEDTVRAIVAAEPEREEELKSLLADLTSGTGVFLEEGTQMIQVPL